MLSADKLFRQLAPIGDTQRTQQRKTKTSFTTSNLYSILNSISKWTQFLYAICFDRNVSHTHDTHITYTHSRHKNCLTLVKPHEPRPKGYIYSLFFSSKLFSIKMSLKSDSASLLLCVCVSSSRLTIESSLEDLNYKEWKKVVNESRIAIKAVHLWSALI